MTKETIIARVKKLMEVTEKNGATEAEAIQAALMAQKLIADYDIEETELYDALDEKEDITEILAKPIKGIRSFHKNLAVVIASNFRCRAYLKTTPGEFNLRTGRFKKSTTTPVFYGYETDANAAKLTYDTLAKIGNRIASREERNIRARYGMAEGVYNSTADGFIKGVRSELEKQSQALMLVVPSEVSDGFDNMSAECGFRTARRQSRYDFWDSAYEKGFQEGRDAVCAHRMGTAANEYALPE